MHHDTRIPIAKVHLKYGAFKNMVNEKCCDLQHHLGKKSHEYLLKPAHKIWNVNVRDVSKMINDCVDPKECVLVNSINVLKSYLSEKFQRS